MGKKQYAWKWANSEMFSCLLGSINECLEEARRENNGEHEKLFIGVAEEWDSHIDIDSLIEEIQNDVYRDSEDEIEDYLENVPKEQKEELDKELNKVFEKWKKKYNLKVNAFKVKEAVEYNLYSKEKDKKGKKR